MPDTKKEKLKISDIPSFEEKGSSKMSVDEIPSFEDHIEKKSPVQREPTLSTSPSDGSTSKLEDGTSGLTKENKGAGQLSPLAPQKDKLSENIKETASTSSRSHDIMKEKVKRDIIENPALKEAKTRDIYYKALADKGYNEKAMREHGENIARYAPQLKALGEKITKNPEDAKSFYELARIQDQTGEKTLSNNNYLNAIKLAPDDHKAYYGLGYNFLKEGNHKEAIQWFQEAIKKDPHDANAYNALAYSKLRAGDTQGALQDVEKSISIRPDNEVSHLNRASILNGMGEKDKAKEDFDIAKNIHDMNSLPEIKSIGAPGTKEYETSQRAHIMAQFADEFEKGQGLFAFINPLGHISYSTPEGIKSGLNQMSETKNVMKNEGTLAATVNDLAGIAKILFAAATPFSPGLAAFTIGSETAKTFVPAEYSNYLMAPISTLLEQTGHAPTSQGGKSGAELLDIVGSLVLLHGIGKGGAKLGEIGKKMISKEPLTGAEVNQVVDVINEAKPEDYQRASEELLKEPQEPITELNPKEDANKKESIEGGVQAEPQGGAEVGQEKVTGAGDSVQRAEAGQEKQVTPETPLPETEAGQTNTQANEPITTSEAGQEVKGNEPIKAEDQTKAKEEVLSETPKDEPKAQEANPKGVRPPVSGIKKSLVSDELIKSVDLNKISDTEMHALGAEIRKTGEVKPEAIVDEISGGNHRALQPKEVVALTHYKAELDNKISDAYAEKNKLLEAGEDTGTVDSEIKLLEENREKFDTTALITANQQSLAFRLRKGLLDKDYNLVDQVNKYKSKNNGKIPSEVEARFRTYDVKLRGLNEKIRKMEADSEKAAGEKMVGDIQEINERANKKTKTETKKQVALSPEKLARKLELRKKYGNLFNDVTNIPKFFIEKEGREYASLIFEEAAGEFKEFSKNAIAEFGKKVKPYLPKLFKDLGGVVKEGDDFTKEGKIKVSHGLIRDLVEAGYTDANELVKAVHDIVKDSYPDATEYEVRNAISKYGETSNLSQDVVETQIRKLKRVMRYTSQLEDIANKKRPLGNGLRRDKLDLQEREMIKKIKTELRGLPPDMAFEEGKLKTALDAYKTRTANQIELLKDKLQRKDFAKPEPKKPLIADDELIKLKSEKIQVQEQYDKEHYENELKNRTNWEKAQDGMREALNLPRALMASLDLSAVGVQGLIRTITKPKQSGYALKEMFRQLASEKHQREFNANIKAQPFYQLMKASGQYLSEHDVKMSVREEQFVSGWINHVWDAIGKPIDFASKEAFEIWKKANPYKAAERAYTGYLNAIRVQGFMEGAKNLELEGKTFESHPQEYKDWASYINNATGRGSLGKFEKAAPFLQTFFFSPRKMASRMNLLNPVYYYKMKPTARKMALKNFASFIAVSATVAAISKAGGASVETDPTSSDFMKIRIGKTRIDMWGGFQQEVVLLSRLITSKTKSSTTGKKTEIGSQFGSKTKFDLALNFFVSKEAPVPAIITRALKGKDAAGRPFDPEQEALTAVLPMYAQDLKNLYKEHDPAAASALTALSVFGLGVQTYSEDDLLRKKKKSSFSIMKLFNK